MKIYLFLALILFHINASSMTLKECNQIASELNKNYPMQVDSITRTMFSVCTPPTNRINQPTLRYQMEVLAGNIRQSDLNALVPRMRNIWCTDPSQRELLNAVNIQYNYTDSLGNFIGSITINKRDCR